MIDPEATAQDPSAAATPAASSPATAFPRRRRRWRLIAAAIVAAAGLAAGLVVWAPWIPPPVLRPTGLRPGPATATSLTLRWSQPPTGPLPDKYLIWGNGTVAGSASGTATSYRQTGLNPGSTYQYRVAAVRGGKRSPASALLMLNTVTPPLSQARLQGTWSVYARNTGPGHGGSDGSLSWKFSQACPAGACDVTLHGQDGVHSFTMKLTRAGAVYHGQAMARVYPCGAGASAIPDPAVLKVRLHITAAMGANEVWAATAWHGTMVGTYQYVSSGTMYCPAATFAASLSGTSVSQSG